MSMKLKVEFDGGNAQGIACYAYTVSLVDHDDESVFAEGYGKCYDDLQTNNVAEWAGALYGVMHAFTLFTTILDSEYAGLIKEIELCGDSQLVIRQLSGEYSVNAKHLQFYHEKCGDILWFLKRTHKIEPNYVWNPREKNERADALTHVARKLT